MSTRVARSSGRGMAAFQRIAAKETNLFQVKDSTRLIAFVNEENFGSSKRHWVDVTVVDEATQKTSVRKTVRNCIKKVDERGCPLCKAGDTPKATAYFNVVDMEDPTRVLVWEATTEPFNKILKRYEMRRKNDQFLNDPDIYWAISKEQVGDGKGAWTYSVDPVKARDLEEDWPSVSPLGEDQRAALLEEGYDEEGYVKYPTWEDLMEVVSRLA